MKQRLLLISIVTILYCISYTRGGALTVIAGGIAAVKGLKEVFYTKSSSKYNMDHPFSCAEYCGLEMLNAKYKRIHFKKAGSMIAPFLLRQFKGTVFEEFINTEIEKDPTVTWADGNWSEASAIYEGREGEFGAFHVGWSQLNETDPENKIFCDRVRKHYNFADTERCFNTYIMIQDIKYKLAKLRVVIEHSESSFWSNSQWDEVIYFDPTLTQETVQSLVMHVVGPIMGEYQQKNVAPPDEF
eukprot:407206_1